MSAKQPLSVALIALGLLLAGSPAISQAGVTCGQTITSDRVLQSNLNCGGGDGITIARSGVKLDLNGHTISGSPGVGTGVATQGNRNRVKVVDGRIRGFATAVHLQNGDSHEVRALNIARADLGITLDEASLSTIAGNKLSKVATGIELAGGTQNHVRDNTLEGRDVGVGVLISGGSAARIVGNVIKRVRQFGIQDTDSMLTKMANNTIRGTRDHGISISGGTHKSRAVYNQVEGSGETGVRVLDAASSPAVTGNHVTGNDTGISVGNGVYRGRIRINKASNNRGDGINVLDDDTLIRRNTANNNGELGIESNSDYGGRNSAKGNGGPGQCSPASLC